MRHGMMVWYANSIIGGVPGATMWKNAIDFACFKIADFKSSVASDWDANIYFAAECARKGLPIQAWAYLYGYGDGEATYLKAQYRKLIAQTVSIPGVGSPRLILDLEAEYEKNISAGFLQGLGTLPDTVPLASTVIPMLPYRNKIALVAAENFGPLIPQLYWKDFSGTWRDWNVLIPDWERGPFNHGWARGWSEAMIAFSGNPQATLDELKAFVAVLEGHGVKTIYWWRWDLAPVEWWEWIRAERKKRDAPKLAARVEEPASGSRI